MSDSTVRTYVHGAQRAICCSGRRIRRPQTAGPEAFSARTLQQPLPFALAECELPRLNLPLSLSNDRYSRCQHPTLPRARGAGFGRDRSRAGRPAPHPRRAGCCARSDRHAARRARWNVAIVAPIASPLFIGECAGRQRRAACVVGQILGDEVGTVRKPRAHVAGRDRRRNRQIRYGAAPRAGATRRTNGCAPRPVHRYTSCDHTRRPAAATVVAQHPSLLAANARPHTEPRPPAEHFERALFAPILRAEQLAPPAYAPAMRRIGCRRAQSPGVVRR